MGVPFLSQVRDFYFRKMAIRQFFHNVKTSFYNLIFLAMPVKFAFIPGIIKVK